MKNHGLKIVLTAIVLLAAARLQAAQGTGGPITPAAANALVVGISRYFSSAAPDGSALKSVIATLDSLDLNDPAVRASVEPVTGYIQRTADEVAMGSAWVLRQALVNSREPAGNTMERLEVLTIFFGAQLTEDQKAGLQEASRLHRSLLSLEKRAELEARMRRMSDVLQGPGKDVEFTGAAVPASGRKNVPMEGGLRLGAAKNIKFMGDFQGRQAAWEKIVELYQEGKVTHVAVVKSETDQCGFGSGGCVIAEGEADAIDISGGFFSMTAAPRKGRPHRQLEFFVGANERVGLYVDARVAKIVRVAALPRVAAPQAVPAKKPIGRLASALSAVKDFFWNPEQTAKAPAPPAESKTPAKLPLTGFIHPISREQAADLMENLRKSYSRLPEVDIEDPTQRSWLSPMVDFVELAKDGAYFNADPENPYPDALHSAGYAVELEMNKLKKAAAVEGDRAALEEVARAMAELEPALRLYAGEKAIAEFRAALLVARGRYEK